MTTQDGPTTVQELEWLLSTPPSAVLETLSRLDGDYLILGVAGKMGPSLARMLRRGLDEIGSKARVIGVARFSDPAVEQQLQAAGIEAIRAHLLDRNAVLALPDAKNIIYMAGQKFGTSEDPAKTWALNAVGPVFAAERYAGSRIAAFSTGCVYPLVPIKSGGSREEDSLEPL